ncbi:MAG: ribonuclease P protein component [Bacteroidales bacterium]|nr:ribonuclease P protein component [Bacteroidales bacterium]
MDATLPKSERLCGLKAVGELFQTGKSASAGCLRCKYLLREDEGPSRIVVSVPKRSFKRAVKRNLLKRRIRESFRRQKALLGPGVDILFIYTSAEVLPYEVIYAHMTELLSQIGHGSQA